jgi:hypothetical protein
MEQPHNAYRVNSTRQSLQHDFTTARRQSAKPIVNTPGSMMQCLPSTSTPVDATEVKINLHFADHLPCLYCKKCHPEGFSGVKSHENRALDILSNTGYLIEGRGGNWH